MKNCITCKLDKSLDAFPPNKKNKDGFNVKCRDCYNAYMKTWYANNAEKHKQRVTSARSGGKGRAQRYGISVDEMNLILTSNEGLCNICNKKPIQAIDHCHETGIVRGGLCHGCNTGLGSLGDNVESLTKALDYLKRAAVYPLAYNE